MNISKTVYKISDFLSWQRAKSLVLSPSFQRRPVWKPDAKSYLIDTIVRGLPMPIVFLREQTDLQSLEPIREVVDGQQRLRTVIAFVEPNTLTDFNNDVDNFTVRKTHNSEIAGKRFSELSALVRKRILNYEFSVHILPSETEDREVLQIFARMNSTGVKLNDQELRNAAYYGVFKQLSYRLAYEQLERWREWGIFSEPDIARMSEVEETSDLIQLILEGIRSKSQKDLDKLYAEYDENFPYEDEVTRRFRLVMDKLDEQLGKDLRNTEFTRRPLAHTLFTFYYDLMFGLDSSLEKIAVKNVSAYTKSVIVDASERIAKGKVSEELMKVLRGSTASASSRKARLGFLKERLENAAK
jgi:uncharacterized protein with ParB-like and HNH nuclease domain